MLKKHGSHTQHKSRSFLQFGDQSRRNRSRHRGAVHSSDQETFPKIGGRALPKDWHSWFGTSDNYRVWKALWWPCSQSLLRLFADWSHRCMDPLCEFSSLAVLRVLGFDRWRARIPKNASNIFKPKGWSGCKSIQNYKRQYMPVYAKKCHIRLGMRHCHNCERKIPYFCVLINWHPLLLT